MNAFNVIRSLFFSNTDLNRGYVRRRKSPVNPPTKISMEAIRSSGSCLPVSRKTLHRKEVPLARLSTVYCVCPASHPVRLTGRYPFRNPAGLPGRRRFARPDSTPGLADVSLYSSRTASCGAGRRPHANRGTRAESVRQGRRTTWHTIRIASQWFSVNVEGIPGRLLGEEAMSFSGIFSSQTDAGDGEERSHLYKGGLERHRRPFGGNF